MFSVSIWQLLIISIVFSLAKLNNVKYKSIPYFENKIVSLLSTCYIGKQFDKKSKCFSFIFNEKTETLIGFLYIPNTTEVKLIYDENSMCFTPFCENGLENPVL